MDEFRPLGKTTVMVPRIGIGTWQWGDRMMWNYGQGYGETDIQAIFQSAIEARINFFDTAEVYGLGSSERFLGRFIAQTEAAVVIASKIMPFPWRLGGGALKRALRNSRERLGLVDGHPLDLYQIHVPLPPLAVETWAERLAEAVESGLVKAVGVSNYNTEQMRRAHATLSKHGIPLASNQVEYHLLERTPERTGLLELCQELGVSLIAYSPLGKGALTGKYTPNKLPPGLRARVYNQALLQRSQPLIRLMNEIGVGHGNKTPAQVALNWVMCKGAIPIPGPKTMKQFIESLGALGWQLEPAEVAALDEASERVKR